MVAFTQILTDDPRTNNFKEVSVFEKTKMFGLLVMMTAIAFALFSGPAIYAQEHPSEHPTKAKKVASETKVSTVTVDQMAAAITAYISTDSELKGGFFLCYDASAKKPLQLTLDKVHKERLSQVGENLFFACSDFKSASGKMYDLDFFMESKDGQLAVTEIMIHKEDGKPRYSWLEKDGVWTRK